MTPKFHTFSKLQNVLGLDLFFIIIRIMQLEFNKHKEKVNCRRCFSDCALCLKKRGAEGLPAKCACADVDTKVVCPRQQSFKMEIGNSSLTLFPESTLAIQQV